MRRVELWRRIVEVPLVQPQVRVEVRRADELKPVRLTVLEPSTKRAFFEFSLSLSRACLGKMMHLYI